MRRQTEADARDRFAGDITEHKLTIVRDDGLYRHLCARRPTTGMYWFDIITWPGSLCIRGDMGNFVFARVDDMFEFFGGKDERVNPQYWAEKEVTGAPTRTYSMSMARALVEEHVSEEALGWRDFTEDEEREIREAAHRLVRNEDFAYAEGARQLINEFEVSLHPKEFRFSDTWEWDLEDYTVHFLWCLHAIVWAIGQYDLAHEVVRA